MEKVPSGMIIGVTEHQLLIKRYNNGATIAQLYIELRRAGVELSGQELRQLLSYKPLRKKLATKKETKGTKDTYDEKESKNPEKIEINKLLASLVKKNGLTHDEMVVLESPALATVKELTKVGVRPNLIHIPNHTDAFDKIEHPNKYHLTLGEFLKKTLVTHDYGLIFADYCGTIDGDKFFNPLKDIEKMFSIGLKHEGLLAITINLRNAKKPNDLKNNDISRLNSAVTAAAYENGYTAVELGYGRTYKNSMYFTVFQVFDTSYT